MDKSIRQILSDSNAVKPYPETIGQGNLVTNGTIAVGMAENLVYIFSRNHNMNKSVPFETLIGKGSKDGYAIGLRRNDSK